MTIPDPQNATEVTQDEFYSVIYGEGLNVHPFPERELTTWHFINHGSQTRRIFGHSSGYMHPEHISPKRYYLTGEL
jgi:hypothetical protein